MSFTSLADAKKNEESNARTKTEADCVDNDCAGLLSGRRRADQTTSEQLEPSEGAASRGTCHPVEDGSHGAGQDVPAGPRYAGLHPSRPAGRHGWPADRHG